jgi:hypothetical protein
MDIAQQPKKGMKCPKSKKSTKGLRLEKEQQINLNVKTLDGQQFLLNVSTNDNIFELKKKIHDKKNMSNDDTINDVKIIFKGKQLINESTIGTNNLQNNDDIVIFTIYKNGDDKDKNKDKDNDDDKDKYNDDDNVFNLITGIQYGPNITPNQSIDSSHNILLNNLNINNDEDEDDEDDDDEYDGDFANLTYKPTPEEQIDISELVALGFQESLVVQIYTCCDKNKELAASMLFTA